MSQDRDAKTTEKQRRELIIINNNECLCEAKAKSFGNSHEISTRTKKKKTFPLSSSYCNSEISTRAKIRIIRIMWSQILSVTSSDVSSVDGSPSFLSVVLRLSLC